MSKCTFSTCTLHAELLCGFLWLYRDHDVGGLLKDARLLLQQGAAAKRELAALKSSSERQQQAYRDLLSQHEQLQEAALVLQAKLAAAQAVTGADRLLLKQLVPGLVAEAAAMLSDTATACNEGSHGEKPHRWAGPAAPLHLPQPAVMP